MLISIYFIGRVVYPCTKTNKKKKNNVIKQYILKKIRNTKLLKNANYRKKISKHVEKNI